MEYLVYKPNSYIIIPYSKNWLKLVLSSSLLSLILPSCIVVPIRKLVNIQISTLHQLKIFSISQNASQCGDGCW